MNITVLGCGRWGSFLGWYMDSIGHKVTQWGMETEYSYRILKDTGRNEYVRLSPTIYLTSDLGAAIDSADVIIISISSQALDSFAKRVVAYDVDEKKIVLCMKGIEISTGRRLSEVMIDNGFSPEQLAIWVGPGHIQDFVAGIPNCMVIDSYDKDLRHYLVKKFEGDLIRFYYGNDIIGNEIGAAAKNVIGIAAGMLDGMGLASLKGPLMTRGAIEVSHYIRASGGNPMSAFGLAHLGDYETTLFSHHSNNRRFGEMFVRGEHFDKLAEGVYTSEAMVRQAKKMKIEMPITEIVYETIYKKKDPRSQLLKLFKRDKKYEFED